MSKDLDRSHVPAVDWVAIFGLLLLTRIPWAPSYFGVDRVNLAYALEEFNPALHQPQPPGYPLFVALARLVDALVNDPRTTFLIISVGVSALCLPVLFALAVRMFSPGAARIAVFLLVLNPAFWFTSLRSPLRPHLALFGLLVAYCCWRCFNGERAYAFWGAVALGIGAGFRPDLFAYMFPLWILCAWIGTRSRVAVLQATLILGLVDLVWLVPLFLAAGSPGSYLELIFNYTAEQSGGESIVLGSNWGPWLHQLSRLVTWNGLAVVGWFWALPFFLRAGNRIRLRSPQAGFIAAWVAPGLLLQALIHVATPGHTLFSVAAFCLLGGHVLQSSMRSLAGARRWRAAEDLALGAVLAFNTMVFMNVFTLPDENTESSGVLRSLLSVRNAVIYSAFETSRDHMRWVDDIAHTSFAEINSFTPRDRRSVIISVEGGEEEYNFLNWRVASYYLPMRDIWVLIDRRSSVPVSQSTRLVRGRRTLDRTGDDALQIPVPAGGRIIWLMERDTPFVRELSRTLPVERGRYVLYTDLRPEIGRFNVGRFEFVPN